MLKLRGGNNGEFRATRLLPQGTLARSGCRGAAGGTDPAPGRRHRQACQALALAD